MATTRLAASTPIRWRHAVSHHDGFSTQRRFVLGTRLLLLADDGVYTIRSEAVSRLRDRLRTAVDKVVVGRDAPQPPPLLAQTRISSSALFPLARTPSQLGPLTGTRHSIARLKQVTNNISGNSNSNSSYIKKIYLCFLRSLSRTLSGIDHPPPQQSALRFT